MKPGGGLPIYGMSGMAFMGAAFMAPLLRAPNNQGKFFRMWRTMA
jgi:hypothetical protein